jgi:hypothetical protein
MLTETNEKLENTLAELGLQFSCLQGKAFMTFIANGHTSSSSF